MVHRFIPAAAVVVVPAVLVYLAVLVHLVVMAAQVILGPIQVLPTQVAVVQVEERLIPQLEVLVDLVAVVMADTDTQLAPMECQEHLVPAAVVVLHTLTHYQALADQVYLSYPYQLHNIQVQLQVLM
jgi:hypothetical protein